ncbi:hypothetical protein [Streptomyces fodineus]|uniref:hypothetical protein n=1 Tax=Streptomyces fodineus TaxID=1904616 RepID=UPI00131D8FD3|nr:hypothetical protein [Streptomyces fodineus]
MTDAPVPALTRRMYELRAEGLTMPEIAVRLEAEGYRIPGNAPAAVAPPRDTGSAEQPDS